ncbi:hypothetical protein O181_079117 [Austropuccinia psidii MF-1]|uniref:Integrase catalytic domain-containing protein n=1 Tax=Austropuccinia psidii MF-1 TaxID=1389203 RepID=A0A9Q3FLG7_9BASI|nr:hypothetical protein [Austropuccinia psidii MF-1]
MPLIVNPILTPTQYHSHYPIITPPTQLLFQASQQTFSNTFKQQFLADLYLPQYPKQTPLALKAKFAEIGAANLVVEEVTIDDMAPPGDRRSVCDTGESHSLTSDLSSLCCCKKLTFPILLCVATHTTQQSFVTGVGSLVYPGYRGEQVIVNGVLYSPDTTGTLISPGALVNAGASLELIGNDILISTRDDGPVLCAEYSASGPKLELPFYSRLLACAIDYSLLPTMSTTELIKTSSVPTFLAVTIEPKNKVISERKHRIKTDPLALKDEFFKWQCLFGHTGLRQIHHLLVVADLMGSFDVETINGRKYALNILDVALTYNKCHILKRKSDTTCCLEETINQWQQSSGYLMKILRTDNGGEFNNATMNTWLEQQGITHERSIPFFHQQNGVVEHYNRTIANMGHTILLGSKLPKSFWGHAFMWAVYTNNMLPNLHTGKKTPTEILFKITPQIDRMRIFGETAFIHIPQEKCHKLDDQAVKGKVVMHLLNLKGWLFYIPYQAKFISSTWATFPMSSSLM